MSFRNALGVSRDDGSVSPASWGKVGEHLREHYLENPDETKRRQRMRERLDFYRDNTDEHMKKHIGEVFKSPEIAGDLCKLIPLSGSNNVTRRIVKIVATVYQTPAKRHLLDGGDGDGDASSEDDDEVVETGSLSLETERQVEYDDYETETSKHRKMRLAQRMAQLFNSIVFYPRRVAGSGRRQLRVVYPHALWAIAHPKDPCELIGFCFEQRPKVSTERDDDPCVLGMDDEFLFLIDRKHRIISNTIKEHGLGQIPAILAQNEITDDCLMDATSGDDIIRGHKAALFLDIMMMSAQKNGTKFPYLAGDTARMGTGQPMGEGYMPTLPEGISPGVLDLGDDPAGKIKAARQVVETLAANYNIPVSVFTQDVQATSGDHLSILKSGLSEERAERVEDWRDNENRLAILEGKVFGMNVEGFAADFGEVAVIRGRKEQLDIRKQERSMGLSNAVDETLEDNPDLTEAQAELALSRNVEKQAKWVKRLRALNMPASPTSEEPGRNAEDNGGSRIGNAPGATGTANSGRDAVETRQ